MTRLVKLTLKVAVTVVLILFLVHNADLQAIGEVVSKVSLPWIILGAALGIPAMIASGIRWRQISGYLRVPLPWRFAILGYMEGITFNLLIPGSVGGDLLRVAKVTRVRGQVRRNLAAVMFDRASNLAAILIICLLLTILLSLGPGTDGLPILLGLLLAAAAGGTLGLIVALRLRPLRRFRIVRETIRFASMFRTVFLRVDRLVAIGVWSLLGQALLICSFAATVRSVSVSEISLLQLATVALLGVLATALPFTVAGLGLREGAVIWALVSFGVDKTDAYSVALLFGAVILAQSLPGLLIWFSGMARLPARV